MRLKALWFSAVAAALVFTGGCGGAGSCDEAQTDCNKCPVTALTGHISKSVCTDVIAEYKKQGEAVAELSCKSYLTTLETDCP